MWGQSSDSASDSFYNLGFEAEECASCSHEAVTTLVHSSISKNVAQWARASGPVMQLSCHKVHPKADIQTSKLMCETTSPVDDDGRDTCGPISWMRRASGPAASSELQHFGVLSPCCLLVHQIYRDAKTPQRVGETCSGIWGARAAVLEVWQTASPSGHGPTAYSLLPLVSGSPLA